MRFLGLSSESHAVCLDEPELKLGNCLVNLALRRVCVSLNCCGRWLCLAHLYWHSCDEWSLLEEENSSALGRVQLQSRLKGPFSMRQCIIVIIRRTSYFPILFVWTDSSFNWSFIIDRWAGGCIRHSFISYGKIERQLREKLQLLSCPSALSKTKVFTNGGMPLLFY